MQEVVDEALEAVNGPPGLFNTLLIRSSEVKAIIEDDRIAAVTLTGSTEVGALVASQAAAVVKKQVLELGGSDAFLVLDDADVELAATTAVNSRFTNNSGQSCVSAKRFIVVESVADEFVKLFAEKTAQLVTGDPQKDATQIGPLARPDLKGNFALTSGEDSQSRSGVDSRRRNSRWGWQFLSSNNSRSCHTSTRRIQRRDFRARSSVGQS